MHYWNLETCSAKLVKQICIGHAILNYLWNSCNIHLTLLPNKVKCGPSIILQTNVKHVHLSEAVEMLHVQLVKHMQIANALLKHPSSISNWCETCASKSDTRGFHENLWNTFYSPCIIELFVKHLILEVKQLDSHAKKKPSILLLLMWWTCQTHSHGPCIYWIICEIIGT
jgi:hypothetical protein